MIPLLLLSFLAAAPDLWTYWVQPCDPAATRDSGCHQGDEQLAVWALEAWQRTAPQAIALKPTTHREAARMRIYWASGRAQLYGEARGIDVAGQQGAEVFVLPNIAGPSQDPLLRDTIVYLTCLHESGHGFGLFHTRNFADIMYSFQYGGDITEYFDRYRRQLTRREDIAKHSGISPADRQALLILYGK